MLTPGCPPTSSTLPFSPISLARASAAVSPPLRLSLAIAEATKLVSASVVSTSTTLMPALVACLSGWIRALESLGAMNRASGWAAMTEFSRGICRLTSQFLAPCTVRSTLSLGASALAPQAIVS